METSNSSNSWSTPSCPVQEMVLQIGKAVLESAVPQTGNAYGVLIDEAQDITVIEQLITFVKYVSGNGEAKTVFLGAKALGSPQGPNAESITKKLLDLLGECKLPMNLMSSFVSDGASVMTGKNSGKLYDPLPKKINWNTG